jgi:hypothetical protein
MRDSYNIHEICYNIRVIHYNIREIHYNIWKIYTSTNVHVLTLHIYFTFYSAVLFLLSAIECRNYGYTVSIQTETSDYQCRELHVMLEAH